MMSEQATATDDKALTEQVGHVLRHIWDPIGLGAEGPADEYDSYVPGLIALVRSTTASEAEILAHLLLIESEMMGLAPASVPATRVARALLGLRDAWRRKPDVLVSQVLSADGLHCLWLFRRPDGLYSYEHAALRHEVDVNGSWSWWAGAGKGRSGLFATTDAAEHDARSVTDWMC